jgi:hypothetical protein
MFSAAKRRLGRMRGHTHTAVALNVGEPGAHTTAVSEEGGSMTDDERKENLTPEEVESENGEPLPERTQMSLIGYEGPIGIPGEITSPVVPPEVE